MFKTVGGEKNSFTLRRLICLFLFFFTETMAQKQTFFQIKDFLNNTISDGKDKHLPSGAVRSVWMTLPPQPKNDYDEVYSNLILGN